MISILPGTFQEMRSDVHEPEKYGIWQSVGDTAGPGGLVRALRTIPMFQEIGRAIRDYSPQAWVINYTNPMALCVRTLYEVFPEVKAFGCCHEVFGTQKLLCAMLEDMGIDGAARQQIAVNVMGVNHFTWFDKASYEGMDLFPLYRKFAEKYYETGFTKGKDDNWMNNSFDCSHRVKFDLFLRYGLIAAAGDRHLAEFMPPWYLKDPETVKSWGFGLTPVDWREQIAPVYAGNMPGPVLALTMPHIENQAMIYQAAHTRDFGLALQAFLNEPSVQLAPGEAEALLRQMIRNTEKFLPEGWKAIV